MSSRKQKDNFLKQAGILAIAGIICRIIGILYRSPLTSIIGDEGNGLYSDAINAYTIILLISSYSIPSAVSKIISQKLKLKEYQNAQRIFRAVLLYVIIIGALASGLTFFLAKYLVLENSVLVLKVFAPTIFLSGILGVLRGYFQANKTMLQTSISQIAEQILNAVVSILAAYLLVQTVTGKDSTTIAIYGAAGSAIGTGVGVLTALLFMIFVYLLNIGVIKKRLQRDKTPSNQLESYGDISKMIVLVVTPFILSTAIYNVTTILNQSIYKFAAASWWGYDQKAIATTFGVYSGKAVVISNVPIALATSLAAALIPSISGAYAQDKLQECRMKVQTAMKTVLLIAIPSAVGLFALAEPITKVLFPQVESLELASNLLAVLSISVVFFGLSTLTNAVLQGIGKASRPVTNAAVALIFQTIILVTLLYYTDLGVFALAIANIMYSLLMCIFNQASVKRFLQMKQQIIKSYLLPSLAAAIMGAAAYGVYTGIYLLTDRNLISLICAILIAVLVYGFLLLVFKIFTKEELQQIPKGNTVIKIAEKMHLM